MKSKPIQVITLILGLAFSLSLHAEDGQAAFDSGVEAFRTGELRKALEHFDRAEDLGIRTVRLYFNLGSTHYKLRNFEEARDYFQRIRDDDEWGALAEYNLGLIAERLGERGRASGHYSDALRKSDNERVAANARWNLQRLSDPSFHTTGMIVDPGWVFYASAAVGTDDNPTLVKNDDFAPGKDSDNFAEFLGSVSGYIAGDRAGGLRLVGDIYNRTYEDTSEFDLTRVSAAIFYDRISEFDPDRDRDFRDRRRDRRRDDSLWLNELGFRFSHNEIDGDRFTQEYELIARVLRFGDFLGVDTLNEIAWIDADGTNYRFLTGLRIRSEGAFFRTEGFGSWRAGARLEFNERRDFAEGSEFRSYSPLRLGLFGHYRFPIPIFGDRLSALLRGEFMHSRYPDDEVQFLPGIGDITDPIFGTGQTREQQRKANRFDASLMLNYNITRNYGVFAEYRYVDNDNNLDRFSYESTQILVGIEAAF